MGLFSKKKIKLKRFMRHGAIQYFIDYHKIKESEGFLMNFIEDFIEDKNCLLIIDTDNFFKKNSLVSENKITELKEELDKQGIGYKEMKNLKEADNKMFGMQIGEVQKVNHYQIGLAITSDQLRLVTGMINDYNVFYYVVSDDMDTEKLLKQFYDVHGDYNELDKLCSFHLYNDCYLQRIIICSSQDIEGLIEMKLQKYHY